MGGCDRLGSDARQKGVWMLGVYGCCGMRVSGYGTLG